MYNYLAYQLHIKSDLPLPELIPGGNGQDVDIHLVSGVSGDPPPPQRLQDWQLEAGAARLSIPGVASFLVREGREIRLNPSPQVESGLLRRYLTGNVLGFLLVQRGLLAVHAATLASEKGAILIAGPGGAGKSSLGLAAHLRGASLLADDLAAIEASPDGPLALTGSPQIKISPEAAATLGIPEKALFTLNTQEGKQGYRLQPLNSRQPHPLAAIYFIQYGPQIDIQPLSPRAAVIELLRHSLPTRLGLPGSPDHFARCVKLVGQIPTYRLRRPVGLKNLSGLADHVLHHAIG